jgi:SAM-dependent methyltransferase
MKVTHCYNCNSDKHIFYAEENGYSLVKCQECGLLFLQERPDDDEISQAHMQGKHRGEIELDVTGSFRRDKIPQYCMVLEDIFQGNFSNKQTWLDIGCGHGEFITAVQKYSSGKTIVQGSEPNIYKRASALKRGLKVDYFELSSHPEKYDIISLLNVYSHLPDPPGFLDSLKGLLNPGGEILIQTGDGADFAAEDLYRPFYLPDHISFASERILVSILERIGFKIVSIHKYPLVALDLRTITKEVVKIFLPNYQSKLKYYLNYQKYSQTDMFIRAKL